MPVPADHTDTICVWTDGLIIKTVAHWQGCQRPHTNNKAADRLCSPDCSRHNGRWEAFLSTGCQISARHRMILLRSGLWYLSSS